MYFGEYERTVDYKGRLTVPAHLVAPADDADWSRVMLMKAGPPCIYMYDLATWKAVLNEAYSSMDDDEGRLFMHRTGADAHLSDIDNLKRITVPASLLEHARIDKKAVIVGMFTRLELWSPEVWQNYLDAMEDVQVPDVSDLSRARIRQVS